MPTRSEVMSAMQTLLGMLTDEAARVAVEREINKCTEHGKAHRKFDSAFEGNKHRATRQLDRFLTALNAELGYYD